VSATTGNRDLFRIYAAGCLIGCAGVIAVAFQLSDLPTLGVVIYLAIGIALWGVDLALTGVVRQRDHGLARLVLLAAFAVIWPVAIAALLVFLGVATFKALRR
jgi:hypothetical protein